MNFAKAVLVEDLFNLFPILKKLLTVAIPIILLREDKKPGFIRHAKIDWVNI